MTPKKNENRIRLFETALSLFSRNGFKKTTIEQVARQTGMTKGNIYFYVKNKKDLYHQCINWALKRWQAHVATEMENAPTPGKKFQTLAMSAIGYIEKSPELRQLLARDPDIFTLNRKKDRFPEANTRAMEMIQEILEAGKAAGDFYVRDTRITSRYLFSIYMMFLIQNYVFLDHKDFHEIFDAALELTLKGLLSPPNNERSSQ